MNEREHKYRAWDKILNCYSRCSWAEISYSPTGECSLLNEGRYIPEQYIGLKDKNGSGKKIYENDILDHKATAFDGRNYRGRVGWHQGHCRFGLFCSDGSCQFIDSLNYYEVIGNIHEEAQPCQP